jgi:hypothetical protein
MARNIGSTTPGDGPDLLGKGNKKVLKSGYSTPLRLSPLFVLQYNVELDDIKWYKSCCHWTRRLEGRRWLTGPRFVRINYILPVVRVKE